MVSADELRNVGITALVSSLALATGDGETTRGLIAEVARAAVARLGAEAQLSAAAVREGKPKAAELDLLGTWASWYEDALGSFREVEVGGPSTRTNRAIEDAQRAVREAHALAQRALP